MRTAFVWLLYVGQSSLTYYLVLFLIAAAVAAVSYAILLHTRR